MTKIIAAIAATLLLAAPAWATPIQLDNTQMDSVYAGAMTATQVSQMLWNVVNSASAKERKSWGVTVTATGSNAQATRLTIYTQNGKGSQALRAYVEPRVRAQFGSQLGAGWKLEIGR